MVALVLELWAEVGAVVLGVFVELVVLMISIVALVDVVLSLDRILTVAKLTVCDALKGAPK